MKLFPLLLTVSLLGPVGFQAQQEKPKPQTEPAFEGCLAKSSTEGVFLLTNARAVSGTIVGTGMRFRVMPDNKGVELLPHVNHVVQITGPVEGTMPAAGKQVPEPELPQIRAKGLSMISNECIVPQG